jgi:hypothetical protein
MSLKATCSSCTIHQLRGATFRWNVKNFDLHTREAVNNMQWESWMLSAIVNFLNKLIVSCKEAVRIPIFFWLFLNWIVIFYSN